MRIPFVHIVAIALVVLDICAVADYGQSTNATVGGQITDQAGRSVPGASVALTNLNTNVSYATQTNDQGIYSLSNLPPGIYRENVTKGGFKSIVKSDIELHVQDLASINFQMQLGSVTETVTVEDGAPLINTESAAVSTVVDQNFVSNMPLNGRSFQDLISMTPGVVTQNPSFSFGSIGQGGDFSVNGQRTEANYYTVDGVSGNVASGLAGGSFVGGDAGASGSLPAGTVLGTTQTLVSVDALQEFRVLSSTYSAEHGRNPGGQFSLVTRSGTNELHGTLSDYLRNDFFDANDWFNNSLGKPITALRQNDFGGTLGGPIVIPHLYNGKNKSFFFLSYEGIRLVQPQAASTSQLVPDLFMRQQAPAALQPILNAYPVPNGTDFGTAAAPSLAQFVLPFSVPSNIDSTSIRVDHAFGSKHSLFFRFADTPTSAQARGGSGSASVLTTTSFNTQTYTWGAFSRLFGKANNDFRLGYATSDSEQRSALDSFGGATPIDFAAALGAPGSPNAFLAAQISLPGVGLSLLRQVPGGNRLHQWNVVDTFSIALGRHQLRTGVDYRRLTAPNNPASPSISTVFNTVQSILTNKPLVIGVSQSLSATPIFDETSAFFQDDWHAAPRLSVSLGLRWEVDPPPHGADGKDAYTLLGSIGNPGSLALAPRGTPLWHTSWYNLAPRLGVAWTARSDPGWETVIRGGAGVFFDTNNRTATEGFSGLGFQAFAQYTGASVPITPAQLNVTPSVTPPFSNNVYIFPAHLQLPYTLQWNVSIQQAIGAKQALTLSYVGAAGRRLQGQQQFSLTAFNSIFGSSTHIIYWTPNLTSDYDALQVQFQRSVSQGIHALASYTWSHCLDSGSAYTSTPSAPGINQIAYRRGGCDFDVRHNLQGGVSWELPSVSGNKFGQALANRWGLDARLIARTGFPLPLLGSALTDPVTGVGYFNGVDLVPNQPIYLYGSQYPGGRAINRAAFAVPTGSVLGTAGRNLVRGFGAWQVNMTVRREFPLYERLHLQFRADAFNVFNRPNFGQVDRTLTDANFGRAFAMVNQGLTTLASQYQQGGPRSMQFALNLIF